MKLHPAIRWFLVLFITTDLIYSFVQYHSVTLDGDLVPCVLGINGVEDVLSDPLGQKALVENKRYLNPNRFFSHAVEYAWFNSVPFFLQNFTDPVESVYLSAAILKILTHLLLLFTLASFISGTLPFSSDEWLLGAALIIPLFQAGGWFISMGMVDIAVTYTIFYALPLGFMLLFFLPLYFRYREIACQKFSLPMNVLLIFLCIAVPLSSPLCAPAIVFICGISLFRILRSYHQRTGSLSGAFRMAPKYLLIYFSLISLVSLYSLYIGSFNSNEPLAGPGLAEQYKRLPKGLYDLFTERPGFLILTALVAVQIMIAWLRGRKNLLFPFIAILAGGAFWIILLPLGGFREYRPNIIRYDTIMPITLGFIWLFGVSAITLLRTLGKWNRIYIPSILGITLLFMYVDGTDTAHYRCQRNALETIAASEKDTVMANAGCFILSWGEIKDPAASRDAAKLLQLWNITDKERLFYQD